MSSSTELEQDDQELEARRKRIQKTVILKAGEYETFGSVPKCRKIYTSVKRGVIKFDIKGRYNAETECQAGYTGGILSSGGGDFEPADLDIRILALVDAEFYIHIEWVVGGVIIFGES